MVRALAGAGRRWQAGGRAMLRRLTLRPSHTTLPSLCSLESMWELPLYLLLGGVCGVVSASFSFSTRVATGAALQGLHCRGCTRSTAVDAPTSTPADPHALTPRLPHRPPLPPADAFDELRSQNSFEAALMPCIGGLTTGVLALGYPEILYQVGAGSGAVVLGGWWGRGCGAPGLLPSPPLLLRCLVAAWLSSHLVRLLPNACSARPSAPASLTLPLPLHNPPLSGL